jgi:hypothetical protein
VEIVEKAKEIGAIAILLLIFTGYILIFYSPTFVLIIIALVFELPLLIKIPFIICAILYGSFITYSIYKGLKEGV